MKRLAAKTGSYQDKDGKTKGKYVDIGVLQSGGYGEYLLLNPTVDLAGILALQNMQRIANGKSATNSVMVSVFERDNNNATNNAPNNAPSTPGTANNPQQGNMGGMGDMDDDIPF